MRSVRIDKLRSAVNDPGSTGFTLFELVVTLAVLAVLVIGTIPLSQNAIKRQKELRLRETLRQVRAAIDEFRRDAAGACIQGRVPNIPAGGAAAPADPRSRVVIDDCTIFDTENLDRYPPDLETLVNGVRVRQRGINLVGGRGLGNDPTQATDINENEELIKVYLREMPIDPMTGESDWQLRSSYQEAESNWDQINAFDIRSSSNEEGLNGEKYSDW